MMFDKLCRVADLHAGIDKTAYRLRSDLKCAALFDLRGLDRNEDVRWIDHKEMFELVAFPFPIVALEDSTNLIVLHSVPLDWPGIVSPEDMAELDVLEYERSYSGGLTARIAANFERQHNAIARAELAMEARSPRQPGLRGTLLAFWLFDMRLGSTWTLLGGIMIPTGVGEHGELGSAFGFTTWVRFDHDGRTAAPHAPANLDACAQLTMNDLCYALRELWYVQQPKRWIVRVTPKILNGRATEDRPKIARSHQRPRYIVVSDRELVRYIGNDPPEGEGRKLKAGHRRRGHWRLLESPRFRFKRGRSIWTRPTWVGPKEGVRGGEHYEVLVEQ